MATRFKEDENVRCAWYKKETNLEVKCEGLCSKTCAQVFKSWKEKHEYKYNFCNGNWQACEHSRALFEKDKYENG